MEVFELNITKSAHYWFEVAEQANPAGPHLVELDGDSSFRGDAGHGSLPKLLMNHLASQSESPINSTYDCQHRHQSPHSRALGLWEVLLKKTLQGGEKK